MKDAAAHPPPPRYGARNLTHAARPPLPRYGARNLTRAEASAALEQAHRLWNAAPPRSFGDAHAVATSSCLDNTTVCGLLPWGPRLPCRHRWVQLACPQTCFTCDPQYPPRHRVKLVSAPRACGTSFCVLLATAVSSRDTQVAKVVEAMTATCRLGFARGVLNLFDADPLPVRADATLIRTTTVRGFKPHFWKAELTPTAVAAFTHVFLYDSDLQVHPEHFRLWQLLGLMNTTGVHIMQPAPYGSGNGLHKATSQRAVKSRGLCAPPTPAPPEGQYWPAPRLGDRCVACRVSVVEVKMPLFTVAAWQVVASVALAHMSLPMCDAHRDADLDLFWCKLVDHHLGACDCPTCAKLNETYALERRCLSSCAVSYATPIFHRDEKTLNRLNRTSGERCARNRGARSFSFYKMSPTWAMLPGPMRAEPCWHAQGVIADALGL